MDCKGYREQSEGTHTKPSFLSELKHVPSEADPLYVHDLIAPN
jgi:hypothetical protein